MKKKDQRLGLIHEAVGLGLNPAVLRELPDKGLKAVIRRVHKKRDNAQLDAIIKEAMRPAIQKQPASPEQYRELYLEEVRESDEKIIRKFTGASKKELKKYEDEGTWGDAVARAYDEKTPEELNEFALKYQLRVELQVIVSE